MTAPEDRGDGSMLLASGRVVESNLQSLRARVPRLVSALVRASACLRVGQPSLDSL